MGKNLSNKTAFTITSSDGYERETSWNLKENQLVQNFYAGQVSYCVSYNIIEIEPKNLIYIAAENRRIG